MPIGIAGGFGGAIGPGAPGPGGFTLAPPPPPPPPPPAVGSPGEYANQFGSGLDVGPGAGLGGLGQSGFQGSPVLSLPPVSVGFGPPVSFGPIPPLPPNVSRSGTAQNPNPWQGYGSPPPTYGAQLTSPPVDFGIFSQPRREFGLDSFVRGFQGIENTIVRDVRYLSGLQELEKLTGINIPTLPEQLGMVNRGIQNVLGGQPNPLTPVPLAPLINPQDCPACSQATRQTVSQLRAQEGLLQSELQTEQQQGNQERLQQQQQQIEHFHQLEQQPPSTRDINNEIQQKQALLRSIQNEISQLQQGQQPLSPISPPSGGSELPPLISSPSSQGTLTYTPPPSQTTTPSGAQNTPLLFQGETPPSMPDAAHAVKFCVSCTSQNEALKFLNGEPSECAVMP